MKHKQAVKVLSVLREIEQTLASYYEGEESDAVIAKLDEKIAELRDTLWHVMPRAFALQMDEEDGLPAGRGEWP